MELKAKEPKVRFGEFTGEWEQLLLKDGLVKNSKKNKGLSISNVESVSNKTGFTKQTEQFDDYSVASADLSNYYVIAEKQFAYNPSRINVGSIAYKTEGDETSVVSPLYVSFFTNEILDDKFLWYWFKTSAFEKQRQRLSEGGVRDTLSFNQLSQMSLLISQLEEQKQVGKFLATIDDSLKLHQQELEKLKESKKTLLSKMFPKEGADSPEIRFAGFTDPWEQCKFSETFNFPISTNSLSRAMLNYDRGEVKSIHYGDVLIKYPSILDIRREEIPFITNGTLEKYKANLLVNGDLIFADAAEDETVGKAVEIKGITDENIVSGLHTIVARANQHKAQYFLGYYINSDIYHRQLLRLMQGSKVSAISKGNLQKTKVIFPKDIGEQQKIGDFFKKFDTLITLHHQELENLKALKKTLLNLMFV